MRTARTVVRRPPAEGHTARIAGRFQQSFLRLTGSGAGGGVVTVTLQTRPIADIATMGSKAAVI